MDSRIQCLNTSKTSCKNHTGPADWLSLHSTTFLPCLVRRCTRSNGPRGHLPPCTTSRKGPHQFGSIKGFGAGARRGTLFSQKKCGAPWRVPASCPWTLRAVPDWASPGIPEAPAPTPVWIVLGCQSVAAAQLVRGSHSLSARKPRASQAAATRPSERKTAAKVAASSQCVVASL